MKFKTRFLTLFTGEKRTMQRKLFGYMFSLTAVMLCLIVLFLIAFGRFSGTNEEIYNVLSLQYEVLEREISAHYDDIASRCVVLSKNTNEFTQKYLDENSIKFDDLANSVPHIENLENKYMDILTTEILKVDCSGAFVMLNTTRTAEHENSKACVYIQRDVLGSDKYDAMLLYRGTAALGKEKGIMPHRKWNLEFDKNEFPNYEEIFYSQRTEVEHSCHITDVIVLPGMSEKAMLVAVPIRDEFGETFGICGFEVSESLFKLKHAQPTKLQHLTGVFSRKGDNVIDCGNGFACGMENGYFLPVKGKLKLKNISGNLSQIENENGAYVGIVSDVSLCVENNNYEIAVMIPKYDYLKAVRSEIFQIILVILLSSMAAVILCFYFSKKYSTPILKGFNRVRVSGEADEKVNIAEIDEFFEYIGEMSAVYKQKFEDLNEQNQKAKNTIEKLAYDRKKEVSPDDYEYFHKGLKTLTPAEKNIFNMYLSGKTIRQIAEENGIKESTVKFHNHNIYDKLGVANKKQLMRYAAMYMEEKDK